MDLCTKLSDRVLDLERTKTTQAKEIASLKKRVKKLERKKKSKNPGIKRLFKVGRSTQVVSSEDDGLGNQEDASKQGRKIDDIDKDAEVTLVNETQGSTAEVSAATTITTEEITLAQALAELRSEKPKVVVQEPVQSTTTTTPSTIPKAKSITFRGPAKEEEQARLIREKAEKVKEANISWDNVQVMIEANRLLAERLQAREQEELTYEEKEKLFVELLEKRKKHFLVKESSKKAEAEMAQESSSKRVGEELEQEVTKKHKMEDDKEKEDLKQCFKIVQDDEVETDAIPLATKPAPIVNFQIHRKGRNGYYEKIRADGSSKIYLLFSQLIKSFDREDLETLWKLVKAKHGSTRPE
ncbi:hypothetical protein Tco_1512215, partial [Tanacetum coccineum]